MSEKENRRRCCLLGIYKTGAPELEQTTWCGREDVQMEWLFQGPTHALLAAKQGSLIQLCQECKKAMIRVLEEEGK